MNKKILAMALFVFLAGCASTWNAKTGGISQYHDETDASLSPPIRSGKILRPDEIQFDDEPALQTPVMQQAMYWQKAREEFPEYYDRISHIIDELIVFIGRGDGSRLRPEDQETMDDIARHFWFTVRADYKRINPPPPPPRIDSPSRMDPMIWAGLMGLGFSLMEQSRPQPLPFSGMMHCTSQYRPWGNGMVDTTCY